MRAISFDMAQHIQLLYYNFCVRVLVMSMNQLFELFECVYLTTVASFVAVRILRPSCRSLHVQRKKSVTVIDIDMESPKVVGAVRTIQTAYRRHSHKKKSDAMSSESVGRVLIPPRNTRYLSCRTVSPATHRLSNTHNQLKYGRRMYCNS